jgi:cytochrome d ubiquinol oxidase subunit I
MDERISAGRALMGDSLGFHLIFVIFGVGLPLLIWGMELYGIMRHSDRALMLARTWGRALVVLFIVGAVSGTIVSQQFNLFWPKFMEFIGKTAGLAFVLEGSAFMVEAIFLSVYMLSWNKFKPTYHWLCGLPVVLGALMSAVFITSANAFMNQPVGFIIGPDGQPTNVNVAKAIFNPAMPTEVTHSIITYILTTVLVVMAVYAWLYHKPNHAKDRHWMAKLITGLAILAVILGSAVGITGDRSGKFLAKNEPHKLAAAEGLMDTQTHAPLIIGGVVSGNQIKYGIKVPSLLSFLATNRFGAEVKGLNDINPQERPPVIIHYFFDGMVGIGMLIVALPLIFLVLRKWRPQLAFGKPMLFGLISCGFLAILATEFGWMLTELGRQPYVIQGYMKTADALTTSNSVIKFGFIFPIFYTALLITAVVILRKVMRHGPVAPKNLGTKG